MCKLRRMSKAKEFKEKERSAMASLYVYLGFTVCYLPNICVLTLILGIVNYQLEVAIATPKTARH